MLQVEDFNFRWEIKTQGLRNCQERDGKVSGMFLLPPPRYKGRGKTMALSHTLFNKNGNTQKSRGRFSSLWASFPQIHTSMANHWSLKWSMTFHRISCSVWLMFTPTPGHPSCPARGSNLVHEAISATPCRLQHHTQLIIQIIHFVWWGLESWHNVVDIFPNSVYT